MATSRVKIRPLSPAERNALTRAYEAVGPMCDLLRMVPPEDWVPELPATLAGNGELRRRFFEAEKAIQALTPGRPAGSPQMSPPTMSALDIARAEDERRGAAGRSVSSERVAPEPEPAPKSLFKPEERMHLRDRGYSDDDIARIRVITVKLVEGQVLNGTLNPENDVELKKAIKQAGRDAMQAFNAALEYLSG